MRILIGLLTVMLAGCGAPPPPVISDISDSAARVRYRADALPIDIKAAGDAACANYGKKAAPISYQCVQPDLGYYLICEQLFACKAAEQKWQVETLPPGFIGPPNAKPI